MIPILALLMLIQAGQAPKAGDCFKMTGNGTLVKVDCANATGQLTTVMSRVTVNGGAAKEPFITFEEDGSTTLKGAWNISCIAIDYDTRTVKPNPDCESKPIVMPMVPQTQQFFGTCDPKTFICPADSLR